jgi:hypothetical protein
MFIILNAPWFMNMMWTILRPFLPVFIISKIVIFKSGSSQLHHFIDSNQAFHLTSRPSCYSGPSP